VWPTTKDMSRRRVGKQIKEAIEVAKNSRIGVFDDFRHVIEQIPSQPTFGWSKEAIQSTILNHDQGRFQASEQLYHAMRREPRIYAALRTRVETHRSSSFTVKVKDDAPMLLKQAAKELQARFDVIIPKETISEILSRIIMFGFCIARHEMVYDLTSNQIMPRIVPWSHSYTYYNFTDRRYHVVADTLGDVTVTGDPWIVFSSGGDRPWLNGAMRALAQPFWSLNEGLDGWNNYNDDEARAYKHLSVPVIKREQTETDSLYAHASMSRGGDTIITASDTTFEFVSPKGRSGAYKTFEDQARLNYDTISIVLLGNNLVQEIKGGSFAAATAANGLAREIIESDTENVEHPINTDTLRLWTELNFTPEVHGYQSLQTFKPSCELAIENVQNDEAKAKTAQQYADSFQKFSQSVGVEIMNNLGINWKEAARKVGIPLIEDEMDKERE